jgi:hypothetical protein
MKRAHEGNEEEEDELKCVAPIKKPRTALDPPSPEPAPLHPLDKTWYFVASDEPLASGYAWDPQTAIHPAEVADTVWQAYEDGDDTAFATALGWLTGKVASRETEGVPANIVAAAYGTWTRFEKKKSLQDAGRVIFYSSAKK